MPSRIIPVLSTIVLYDGPMEDLVDHVQEIHPPSKECWLCRMQQVTKAQSISFGDDRLLKCFKRRNLFFRIPNTPSMSFRTGSTIADHFIAGLPGKPFLTGNAKQGHLRYPPSDNKYKP
jgi:hypothetical protein